MAEKYIPKTETEKIEFLMATDERRERHIKELQKDINTLTVTVGNLTTAIIGSPLNGNKGFVNLMEAIEEKVEMIEKSNTALQKDIETAKFWGRGMAGVLFASMIVIINYIKDKV